MHTTSQIREKSVSQIALESRKRTPASLYFFSSSPAKLESSLFLGQGTSKERRYGSNMPRGSYASQMSGVAVLDRERAAFCAPQPVRKRTSLESDELPRRKKSKSEDWSGRATARAISPADGRRRSLDTDSVPAQKQRKKTTKEQDRCKIIKKALKKLGKK